MFPKEIFQVWSVLFIGVFSVDGFTLLFRRFFRIFLRYNQASVDA